MATKVVWAALVIEEDKEVTLIEPLKVKFKDAFGSISTVVVEGHITPPDTFLQKVSSLVSYGKEVYGKR
jgi:hypothetical protein